MFENELLSWDEADEQFQEGRDSASGMGESSSFDARRRIERLRELRHLRDLLDDPEFNDFD